MKKIIMMNQKIAVQKIEKSDNKESNDVFTIPEVSDNLGIVMYTQENSEYKIGDKVYYGSNRESIRMHGIDVNVMDESNIVALVEESDE